MDIIIQLDIFTSLYQFDRTNNILPLNHALDLLCAFTLIYTSDYFHLKHVLFFFVTLSCLVRCGIILREQMTEFQLNVSYASRILRTRVATFPIYLDICSLHPRQHTLITSMKKQIQEHAVSLSSLGSKRE